MKRTKVGSLALALVLSGCAVDADTSPSSTTEQTSTTTTVAVTTSSSEAAPDTTSTTSPGATDSHLLVVGDWGSGTLPQGAVAGAMQRYAESHPIEAILSTGDNFYTDDTDFLMEPYGWVAEAGIPWWITWGNHDVETQIRVDAVNETFDSPPRWTVRQWGQIDLIILDSNQVTDLRQAAFFLSTMADSDRATIVAVHHPPYSCSHHGSTTEIVNVWVSVLDSDVMLVLSGHDHSYQRFENQGVNYVVTGGGGRELHPLSECPENHPEPLAGEAVYHFLALEQTETAVKMTAYDVNGDEIETVIIDLP